MKVVIIETVHFQYGITQSELFEEAEKIFFVTRDMYDRMHAYAPELCHGRFIVIRSVHEACEEIIRTCNEERVDLLLISPIFTDFKAVHRIVTQVQCETAMTIHNLNYWLRAFFRTPKYYRERRLKQRIAKACDYLIVEDFMFQYVKHHEPKLFREHRFLYVPFTIFHPAGHAPRPGKEPGILQVVLPGTLHRSRRRYEAVLQVIHRFAERKAPITFTFAGRPVGDYGKWVVAELDKANAKHPGIARYFPMEGPITPGMFQREMETSDLVLSTSTTVFDALGTKEYIGKTKPTAAIHDMMSFRLPGLLPAHMNVPRNLAGSVFNYADGNALERILQELMDRPELLRAWQDKAGSNALHFTAPEVRRNLPFFGNRCTLCGNDHRSSPGLWLNEDLLCEACYDQYLPVGTHYSSLTARNELA